MLFFITSCNLFKHTNKSEESVVFQPSKIDTIIVENIPIEKDSTIHENTTHTKNNFSKKSWEKKSSYNIAFILPFEMDAIELNTLLASEKINGYQPLASIEFYEGALIAFDTLQSLGVNLNIHVYDNVKDSISTAVLFEEPEMKNMDIIIGPMFNTSLKIAADFAKKNEIFLISPLSPSQNITTDNRFFLMANSTLKVQLQKTVDYIYTTDKNANVMVIYRTDKEAEKKIAKDFIQFAQVKYNKSVKELANSGGVSSEIVYGNKNYIFIASSDELYVNGILRNLSVMSRADENVNVIGLPTLLDMESLSIDYFESLNFHYPTSYWVDPNAPRTEKFEKSFKDKYACYPSDYAFRGYDITFYFGQMLYYFGPDITANLDKFVTLRSPLYRFQFVPNMDDASHLRFYENENIVILKYDNYRFEKVN